METPEGQESKKGFFARLSPIVHRRSKSRSKSPRRESPTSSPPSLSKSSPNSTAQHTLENESLVTEEEKEISGNSEKRGRKKVDGRFFPNDFKLFILFFENLFFLSYLLLRTISCVIISRSSQYQKKIPFPQARKTAGRKIRKIYRLGRQPVKSHIGWSVSAE